MSGGSTCSETSSLRECVAKADRKYDRGDFKGAEELYCRVLEAHARGEFPSGRDHPAFVLFKLARALRAQDQLDEAAETLVASINARPNHPGYNELGALTFVELGGLLMAANHLTKALDCFERAITLVPSPEAFLQRGTVLQELGRFAESRTTFSEALAVNPLNDAARFGLCIAELLTAYSSEAEIETSRIRYTQQLRALSQHYFAATPEERARAGTAVGVLQPFYLAYQGGNDRDLQRLYGETVCALMAARLPEWSRPRRPRARARGDKIRVGFVSRYFFSDHSVWKLPLRGWIEGLDRSRFSLFGYNTKDRPSAAPPVGVSAFARYVDGAHSTEEWCKQIARDDLDALIYPEFGMDPESVPLGALRLAPLQMTSLGHPTTSGMPTIDVYLSSELMEPENGASHYTEELVRLPNLGFAYAPVDVNPDRTDMATLGIGRGDVLFWCCQSLFKFLPQHDDVFPRIAKGVPTAKFAFIEDHRNESNITKIFQTRLSEAFARHELQIDAHCVFLPHMNTSAFAGMCAAADVFLDGIAWSGCNTALEAVAQKLPIVTLAGEMMRSRHSQAILRFMGSTETIASTEDEYVEIAVRLGRDPQLRTRLAREYELNKHRLYSDPAPIRGLERLLEERTGSA